MKPSTRNKIAPNGKPLLLIYMGDILFFGGELQQWYTVDEIKDSRPFSEGIDLFQLWKDTNVLPVIFEK